MAVADQETVADQDIYEITIPQWLEAMQKEIQTSKEDVSERYGFATDNKDFDGFKQEAPFLWMTKPPLNVKFEKYRQGFTNIVDIGGVFNGAFNENGDRDSRDTGG
jgi:hypothetical protein